MHAQCAYSTLENCFNGNSAARLALGGGSDRPPPGEGEISAEIIRFPLERRSQAPVKDGASAPGDDTPASPDADPAPAGSMWGAWLSSVLSSDPLTGIRAERS